MFTVGPSGQMNAMTFTVPCASKGAPQIAFFGPSLQPDAMHVSPIGHAGHFSENEGASGAASIGGELLSLPPASTVPPLELDVDDPELVDDELLASAGPDGSSAP